MVGYEWKFLRFAGLTGEFDGFVDKDGAASARVYLGIIVGW
jgi:hypothetical protein